MKIIAGNRKMIPFTLVLNFEHLSRFHSNNGMYQNQVIKWHMELGAWQACPL